MGDGTSGGRLYSGTITHHWRLGMGKIRTTLQSIHFEDAGGGDGTQIANVEWKIVTQGGVAFTIPMQFDIKSGEDEKVVAYARAALHHLSRHLAEETKEWAQPD